MTTSGVQSSASPDQPLLIVDDLEVRFGDAAAAITSVSISIYPQQTLAIVGESGSGKSMTALSIMRLVPPPGVITRGAITLKGRDLLSLPPGEMLKVRGRQIAMIFQEPMTSLNPVFTIGDQIIEAIKLHQAVSQKQATEIALNAMHEVGITNPAQRLRAYPHQFSGGMRQRVMIAMALACQPNLLLADEPTTALDVTIQAQILELLARLKDERGMGLMLITHDLGVVAQHADIVAVMYAGRIVEYASVFDIFERPLHPYTQALLQCRPSMQRNAARLPTISDFVGEQAEFASLEISGAALRPWWPRASAGSECTVCEVEPEHWVACETAPHVSRKPDSSWRRPVFA